MNLEGRTVLVTGANGGIGESIVGALLDKGVTKVYAAARNIASLERLCAAYPHEITPVMLDITDHASLAGLAAQCADIDVLINNAGVNYGCWASAPDALETARMEMEVNYFGTFHMCRTFAPLLIQKGRGVIVNVCSLLSFVAMPANATYCASKAALHSLTQSLRGELLPQGVNVIGVYPGPVDTRMTASLEVPKIMPEEVARDIVAGIMSEAYRVLPGAQAKACYATLLEDYEKLENDMSRILPPVPPLNSLR